MLAAAAVFGCSSQPGTAPTPRVGNAAPEITGMDADGTAFKLSDYRGKVVLLDFWMTG
jgi:peroxiredoxin